MVSRREWLRLAAGASAAIVMKGCAPSEGGGIGEASASAAGQPASTAGLTVQPGSLIMRAVPSSGEQLPVVGLGGANTFSETAGDEDFTTIGNVLKALVDGGGKVFDTAAGYGASEEVSGRVAQEVGIADRIWWATKVNVARGGTADPTAVREQLERSFTRLRIPRIDLIQVHNMGDPPTQLGILQELKASGRIRYIGITTTSENQYGQLEQVMRQFPLDFIGVDYAVDNRVVEQTILPLAQDRGTGVLVYLPFGRSRMWQRIGDRPLPEWAAEFDATSWAQFMLKFVIAHPAVTVATPGTSDPEHMLDNLGGGMGRLPTREHLQRMAQLVDSLPSA